MGMTDPIADLLTRIRNGKMAGKEYAEAPVSKIKAEILRILKKEGYIKGYTQDERTLRIYLKYSEEGESVITEITRISKPGCRVYKTKEELPKVLNGLGIAIISTSKGLLTDRDARLANVGGEVLCTVW
jgi:small subunit ribosomal protein S8